MDGCMIDILMHACVDGWMVGQLFAFVHEIYLD